ncbi:MAG: choice-of-anchor I family protein [Planctomycetota bacterium]|jgi:DNA-binding beta-propeller fold protein YncE
MKKLIFTTVIVCFFVGQVSALELWLEPVGTYRTGIFDDKGAQILDYHAASNRIFITNPGDQTIDVVSIQDVDNPELLLQIPLDGAPMSVAVHPTYELIAVAIEGEEVTDCGTVGFYSLDGDLLGSVAVGPLPDMVTWTRDGRKVLVANEGEPTNTEYEPEDSEEFIDPNGSISIIKLGPGSSLQQKVQNATVVDVGFEEFNDKKQELLDKGVRIYGPDATVAQDLEPEYITLGGGNRYAYVTMQENNAIAKIDILKAEVIDIIGIGYKDHSIEGNGLDASNKDDAINIVNWPVFGMYQPDAIDSFKVDDELYLIIANEGDARDFEEKRVAKLDLSEVFGTPEEIEELQENENLGRLKATKAFPATKDDEGNYTSLYSYGGRSFSILDADGNLVFDSGDQLEQITAEQLPDYFNSTDDETDFDDRSDDKGPEPEHVTVGKIYGHTIAFIGIERIGGIMAYDVSNPAAPEFLDYVNNRNFEVDPELDDGTTNPEAGDLGTEGLVFIPARRSPNGCPLVVASHEISGTTTVFQINVQPPPDDDD